jgi:alpha-tubulin suppressor-like RCC1 family protein
MPNYSGVWTLQEHYEAVLEGNWPEIVKQQLFAIGGYNGTGGLGDGTVIDKSSPVQIGSDVNWSMASVGNANFTAAVKTDGTLWSWGYNNVGQLGHNNTTNKSSPVQIGALTNWSSVAAGDDHCIAIKTDGTLWAWGNNNSGQITGPIASEKSSPIQIGSLTNWSSVACGLESSYALTSEGELYAWGNNGLGELGDNTVVFKSSPVQIGALTNWSSINGGSSIVHAIKTDGTLWGWGTSVFYGSVGDGNKINHSSPVQIGSLTTWSVIGDAESSAFAIKTDGTLWSWGRNETFGTLGINSVVNVSSPVQIGSETNWSKVDGGGLIASAITTSGELYSWGRGANGRTGQNTTDNSSSPVQIGGLTSWSDVDVGNNSIVAFNRIT